MIALTTYGSRIGADGRIYVRSDMQADTMPAEMPHTYDDVEGMRAGDAIDVGSRIDVLDASQTYVLGEDWNWYPWSEGSGGGGITEEVDPKAIHSLSRLSFSVEREAKRSTYVEQSDGSNLSLDIYTPSSSLLLSYVDGNGKNHSAGLPVTNYIGKLPGKVYVGHVHSDVDKCTYLVIYYDTSFGQKYRQEILKIPDPIPGPQGDPGLSPVVSITEEPGSHHLTITDAEGDHSTDILDGADGLSPQAMAERIPATDTVPGHVKITITDAQGTTEGNVYDGERGENGDPPEITLTATQDGVNVPVTKTGSGAEQAFALAFAAAGGGAGATVKQTYASLEKSVSSIGNKVSYSGTLYLNFDPEKEDCYAIIPAVKIGAVAKSSESVQYIRYNEAGLDNGGAMGVDVPGGFFGSNSAIVAVPAGQTAFSMAFYGGIIKYGKTDPVLTIDTGIVSTDVDEVGSGYPLNFTVYYIVVPKK